MILRSIDGGDDNIKTPTKLNTGGAGLKTDNAASNDASLNTELGPRHLSLEDSSAGGLLSTLITISDSLQTDKTSEANSIVTEYLLNVNTNNKEHNVKVRTEGR